MTLMHRCPPGAPLCETCQAEYDKLMDFLKDNAKDIESPPPSGQTDFDLLGGNLFNDGVLWYEKQLYDLLQSKGWGDVCAASIVSEMAEVVAKKIAT